MMNKSILALVVAAAFSAQANAIQYKAENYTIDFDETFWGTSTGTVVSWKPKTGTLTFSDLGLSAIVTGRRSLGNDGIQSSYDSFSGYSPIKITAVDGYQIASVESKAKGGLTINAGDGGATGAVFVQALWSGRDYSNSSDYFYSVGTYSGDLSGQYKYTGSIATTFASGSAEGEGPAAALSALSARDAQGSAPLQASGAGGVQSTVLSYFYAEVDASAQGQGAKSTSRLNSLSFSVNVVPSVPEPESYAMLLAGLGLMGTIARRRSKAKAV